MSYPQQSASLFGFNPERKVDPFVLQKIYSYGRGLVVFACIFSAVFVNLFFHSMMDIIEKVIESKLLSIFVEYDEYPLDMGVRLVTATIMDELEQYSSFFDFLGWVSTVVFLVGAVLFVLWYRIILDTAAAVGRYQLASEDLARAGVCV